MASCRLTAIINIYVIYFVLIKFIFVKIWPMVMVLLNNLWIVSLMYTLPVIAFRMGEYSAKKEMGENHSRVR
jgi:hypothetical protein